MNRNILFQWIFWQFFEMPKNILLAWKNFLLFNLNYFSTPTLLKTLFSYWHRYQWFYPKGFSLGKYLEVFFSNLISRVLGALIRSVIIAVGIILELLVFIGGAVIFLLWIISPILILAGLWFSLKIIF